MRASSQTALESAAQRWEPILRQAGDRARDYGEQLFGVVDLLESSPALRRALTDPARDGEDKARLVESLLADHADAEVRDLVAGMVRSRWSSEADLPPALEELGVGSLLAAAEHRGEILTVEDELFKLDRIFATNRDLRSHLMSVDLDAEHREALLDRLLSGKVLETTRLLVHRAAGRNEGESLLQRIAGIAEMAAARRQLLVAQVTVAAPLTEAQRTRLSAVLSRSYGREVLLTVGVDPEVVGGVRIQIGDELIDGTLNTRLTEAERRFAG